MIIESTAVFSWLLDSWAPRFPSIAGKPQSCGPLPKLSRLFWVRPGVLGASGSKGGDRKPLKQEPRLTGLRLTMVNTAVAVFWLL